jgi:hypothetical protein
MLKHKILILATIGGQNLHEATLYMLQLIYMFVYALLVLFLGMNHQCIDMNHSTGSPTFTSCISSIFIVFFNVSFHKFEIKYKANALFLQISHKKVVDCS